MKENVFTKPTHGRRITTFGKHVKSSNSQSQRVGLWSPFLRKEPSPPTGRVIYTTILYWWNGIYYSIVDFIEYLGVLLRGFCTPIILMEKFNTLSVHSHESFKGQLFSVCFYNMIQVYAQNSPFARFKTIAKQIFLQKFIILWFCVFERQKILAFRFALSYCFYRITYK